MEVTFDRLGASVAWYSMKLAPAKASSMVVHSVPPHCSIDSRYTVKEKFVNKTQNFSQI